MRLGFNPHKDKQQIKSDYFHQVVIPVYILNEEYCLKFLSSPQLAENAFKINVNLAQERLEYKCNRVKVISIYNLINIASLDF